MASIYTVQLIEEVIREFPASVGWSNKTYGLDDLDFEDFVPDLASSIIAALESDPKHEVL